jgi:serine/threonine protein kinase
MFSDKDYSLYNGIPKKFRSIRNKQFSEWEIPPWDILIERDKLIGKGQFGKVYLANWKETLVVAKIMNENIQSEKKKLFINEFDNLSKAHHPNIVQLLGYIEEPFIIVMEYLPNKDLLYYINNKKLKYFQKINICLDILKGLNYIHTRRPQYIIHRDLKPQNIVLSKSGKAKISDFGLSKNLGYNIEEENNKDIVSYPSDIELTGNVGSKRYMSPEIKKNIKYNHKIDIWSAGIIFAELFENKRYNDNFYWIKTPIIIKNIIVQHMLREKSEDRLNASEIINLFQQELNKIEMKKKCIVS